MRAIIINHEEKTLGHCSFDKASNMLSKGVAQVKKFYPYTVMLKGAHSPESISKQDITPCVDSYSKELAHV